MSMFADSSNTDWSGSFEYEDNILLRQQPVNQYHFEYYRTNGINDVLWIDPPADVMNKIKMIYVESDLKQYKISGSYKIENQNPYLLGHSRHVDSSCRTATMTSNDWPFLLGDTLNFMQNDCDEEFTNFISIQKFYNSWTEWDYTQSYQYKLDKWFESAIESCGTKLCL